MLLFLWYFSKGKNPLLNGNEMSSIWRGHEPWSEKAAYVQLVFKYFSFVMLFKRKCPQTLIWEKGPSSVLKFWNSTVIFVFVCSYIRFIQHKSVLLLHTFQSFLGNEFQHSSPGAFWGCHHAAIMLPSCCQHAELPCSCQFDRTCWSQRCFIEEKVLI